MRIPGALVLGFAVAAAGCSSTTDAPAGGSSGDAGASSGDVGGSRGDAGASSGDAGASGGGVAQLLARAALTLNFGPPMQMGMSCPVNARSYQLGTPGPSEVNPGVSIVDGDNGAMISCSVTGTGTGPYAISGHFNGTTAQGESINFTMTEGSVESTGRGSATVVVYASPPGTLVSQMPCDVVVISSQVKPGSVWGKFSCSDVSRGPADCAVNGYFVLENCEGS